jgi:hypothetical protein
MAQFPIGASKIGTVATFSGEFELERRGFESQIGRGTDIPRCDVHLQPRTKFGRTRLREKVAENLRVGIVTPRVIVLPFSMIDETIHTELWVLISPSTKRSSFLFA